MRWHKNKRFEIEDMLRHPADVEEWKHFDCDLSDFALDSRNVNLGLASYGFNLFGHMSTSYSMWHMVLIPYNLPFWKCTKESNFFRSLFIPGPRSPGRKISVYLNHWLRNLKRYRILLCICTILLLISSFSYMQPCCGQLMTFPGMMTYPGGVRKGIRHMSHL